MEHKSTGENIMVKEYQEPEQNNNSVLDVLAGMLVGALAGAVTMLLLAPQSGEATRTQIQEKSIELRDRATGMVEETMEQVRMDRNKISMGGRMKAKELLHQGQELVVEQLDHVSEAALAGKKAL
jgi:gas vesicle protein